MSTTPNMKLMRRSGTPIKGITPETTRVMKRMPASSPARCATKSLKFSPHLFKTEPTTFEGKPYSPKGCLEMAAADNSSKGEEDDEIIEIDGL